MRYLQVMDSTYPRSQDPDDFEREHVHQVYECIAKEFSDSRYRVWPLVKDFLDQIKAKESLLEIGCGNGKNLQYLQNIQENVVCVGCDICEKFVQMNVQFGINCVKANGIDLPFSDENFSHTLSVAVIHHYSTEDRRLKAIAEQIRVTKVNGKGFIEVWALEQPKGTKRNFSQQNVMVPWRNHDTQRYYYVFREGELEKLLMMFDNVKILESKYDNGNWVAIFQKIK